jgi:oligopeptide/dipeptide ABC transporter ATP-binding protein
MLEEIVKVEQLKKYFPVNMGFLTTLLSRKEVYIRAVDGVTFDIKKGEIFGLVGESGSGKTTIGRLLLRLTDPTDGKIFFEGKDISKMPQKDLRPLRRKMQIIFQDPYESLNPRMTISSIIMEPLTIQGGISREEIENKVAKALEDVDLIPPEEFLLRFPHELSGGQRQRVGVARALVLNPDFIVADEPVSMLDVSIRAEVVNILVNLLEKYNVSFLFITHDVALARHICNRIAIMYLGKIMEKGPTENVVFEPLHPYTRALISAVPVPDPATKRSDVALKGEIPSPINPPSGCRFHTRCSIAEFPLCKEKEPPLIDYKDGHSAACHLIGKSSWQKYYGSEKLA